MNGDHRDLDFEAVLGGAVGEEGTLIGDFLQGQTSLLLPTSHTVLWLARERWLMTRKMPLIQCISKPGPSYQELGFNSDTVSMHTCLSRAFKETFQTQTQATELYSNEKKKLPQNFIPN